MDIFSCITWAYRGIFALTAALFLINVARHECFTKKLLGVIVTLPLLLRLFGVK